MKKIKWRKSPGPSFGGKRTSVDILDPYGSSGPGCEHLLRLALGQPSLAIALSVHLWLGVGVPILPEDQWDSDNPRPDELAAGETYP
jgi:hypothetical protein